MKQSKSVTTLLNKVWTLFEMVERIDRFIKQRDRSNLTVSFYHDKDRNLIATRWSDNHYGSDYPKGFIHEYIYEVTSKGISFRGYAEYDGINQWTHIKYWASCGDNNTIDLLSIPNIKPTNSNMTTMYLFHQDKIKETLSMLPAWAIACMQPN